MSKQGTCFVLAEGQHRRRRKRLVCVLSGRGFTQTFVVPHDSIKSSLSASGNSSCNKLFLGLTAVLLLKLFNTF